MKNSVGFTIIELMIVITLISILFAISIPVYKSYSDQAKINACLREVKSYADQVFVDLNADKIDAINKPNISSCQAITDASKWNEELDDLKIIAEPIIKNKKIECDVNDGVSCKIVDNKY